MKLTPVKFREWDCYLQVKKYHENDRTALLLVDQITGEPIAKATVNISEENLYDDEIIIKSYEENEGMLDALINAGIVMHPHRWVQCGYKLVPVCILKQEYRT